MSVSTARSHEANFDSHPVSSVGEADPARALANSQRHEQFDNAICNVSSGGSGDNHHSVVPEHDRSRSIPLSLYRRHSEGRAAFL